MTRPGNHRGRSAAGTGARAAAVSRYNGEYPSAGIALVGLPAFDDFGNLPPGIHPCSVAELVARFGSGSDERDAEISELLNFIEAAKTAGVRRLMVNASFVTA